MVTVGYDKVRWDRMYLHVSSFQSSIPLVLLVVLVVIVVLVLVVVMAWYMYMYKPHPSVQPSKQTKQNIYTQKKPRRLTVPLKQRRRKKRQTDIPSQRRKKKKAPNLMLCKKNLILVCLQSISVQSRPKQPYPTFRPCLLPFAADKNKL